MSSRIIVKSLPKKISEEKLKEHFAKVGVITDAKLKYTKDGKFRQFAFVGYKSEADAQKAIEYFNNTYIDASKIIVESCRPLNDTERTKTWSKYSKEIQAKKNAAKAASEKSSLEKKKPEKLSKAEKKGQKLARLLGDLKDDEGFKEFLEANKVITSRENIWKNDFSLGAEHSELTRSKGGETETEKSSTKKTKKGTSNTDEEEKETKNGSDTKKPNEDNPDDKEEDFENGRLFVRNLSYECKEEDLEKLFASYGPLVECSMPLDNFSKKPKGFAFITCMFPEKALKAHKDLDGSIFQGRMLHIMPSQSKREMDEEEELKLGFKQKKDKELKKKSQSSYNWNSLFINQNSLANLMAKKFNIDKSELYDVHQTNKRNKGSVAVKLAVGETQIVNDIKKFLVRNGVKLDSFAASSGTERSKNVMLIKNLPNETSESDLREFMKKNGIDVDSKSSGIKRLVMPEYGIAALIEFNERQEARDAFKKLAYRKFKTMPLYLEWAPVDVFDGGEDQLDGLEEEEEATQTTAEETTTTTQSNANDTSKEKEEKAKNGPVDSSSSTANGQQANNEPNKAASAQVAGRKTRMGKQPNIYKTTKILVRNIPFEAKVKEVEELFRVFGELKYVRLPKKMDGTHRGFGFVDFVTITDAERAFDALSYSTHLFGRRLVLEWAQPEQTQDVEILRQKESQIYGSTSKRLKKSKLLEDLGQDDDLGGGGGGAQMEVK